MLILRRTVRFACSGSAAAPGAGTHPNTYAASPGPVGFAQHFELQVALRGAPHPELGYLMDIKAIDHAARAPAIDLLTRGIAQGEQPRRTLSALRARLAPAFDGRLHALTLHLNSYHSLEAPTSMPTATLMRQKFDFAASHRLHIPALSIEDNRKAFGKCNHPSGHGHNYIIEPCVRVENDAAFTLQDLEPIVQRVLIDRYDHTHLTIDFPEFDPSRGGVNSSVENIARVFYEMLAPHIRQAGATLASITVWETERTSAQYPA